MIKGLNDYFKLTVSVQITNGRSHRSAVTVSIIAGIRGGEYHARAIHQHLKLPDSLNLRHQDRRRYK